jgi:hypothetical protein
MGCCALEIRQKSEEISTSGRNRQQFDPHPQSGFLARTKR